ncbi:sulfurtransferase complex subunit TusB [Vibrio comitans]|uniref:Sulfurtransferase TusB n=1 Tax=Vibrio comitans NBRC 102076 TaxID=1219078 RepID=A0A4Y3IRF0_9VIBR|nr:sulfurtransferase complex subunit TusB [Vibrio comitans]GEA61454.1 sulfurtransferase TusB [Vibrio comitans NBRC 102076]
MLHIVSRLHRLETLSRYVSAKDSLLLVEEAVYAANPKHHKHTLLPSIEIKALEPDLTARGLESVCASHIEAVDFAGFVDLTAEHGKSITW